MPLLRFNRGNRCKALVFVLSFLALLLCVGDKIRKNLTQHLTIYRSTHSIAEKYRFLARANSGHQKIINIVPETNKITKNNYVDTRESITRKRKKSKILLFVGIFTAPIRQDRRKALRETWLRKCKMSTIVVCWFITDGQDVKGMRLQGEVRVKLENESRHYGDLVQAESPAGLNFGRRYLWMIEWASERYDFQYLLRLDDDYFVCFDKLIYELQHHRPKKLFTWGWVHCRKTGNIYVDEAFILITRDIIQSFLDRKNSTLLCHAYGDQSIGIWLNSIAGVVTFADMKRLGDLRPKEKIERKTGHEICHTKLGIHKSYPDLMRLYWTIFQNEDKNVKMAVPAVSFDCKFPRGIDEKKYGPRFAPKFCKDNPIWNFGKYFYGSQGA